MFSDDLDVGIYAEDRQAARVASHALDRGHRPVFQNARGPFVEVQFVPPPAQPSLQQAGALTEDDEKRNEDNMAVAPPLPVLYGWMERVAGDSILHLVQPSSPAASTTAAATATGLTSAPKPSPSQVQVCGQVAFILHLWSTPHTTRAAQMHKMPEGTDGEEGDAERQRHRKNKDDKGLFNARGEDVVLSHPDEEELELRDDREVVRAALDTVVTVGRALRECPRATVRCFRDTQAGTEVLMLQ